MRTEISARLLPTERLPFSWWTVKGRSPRHTSKGPHSFKILALIDPVKVTAASPWAQRFVQKVKAQMGG
jgi:hypothetical protein